jgi:hypothetical protein
MFCEAGRLRALPYSTPTPFFLREEFWMSHRISRSTRQMLRAAHTTYLRHALIGSVAVLLGLFGCSTAPRTSEGELSASRLRVERRYKIEALRFKALDETGYDSPLFAPWISDEVKVILRDPARKVMSVSRIFGDVDTNETRTFGPQENCILPVGIASNNYLLAPRDSWTCNGAGVPGPFYFIVEMYEADSDTWNDIYNCWVEFDCGFEAAIGYQESSKIFTKGDELIGKRSLTFSAEELAAALPRVGSSVAETITLGPCFDERGCVESPGLPTGPEYTFSYRVTRLPDRRVFDQPLPPHPIDPTP